MKIGDRVSVDGFYGESFRSDRTLHCFVYSINKSKGLFKVAPEYNSSYGDSFYTEYALTDFEYIPRHHFIFGDYWTNKFIKKQMESQKQVELMVRRVAKAKKEGWEF